MGLLDKVNSAANAAHDRVEDAAHAAETSAADGVQSVQDHAQEGIDKAGAGFEQNRKALLAGLDHPPPAPPDEPPHVPQSVKTSAEILARQLRANFSGLPAPDPPDWEKKRSLSKSGTKSRGKGADDAVDPADAAKHKVTGFQYGKTGDTLTEAKKELPLGHFHRDSSNRASHFDISNEAVARARIMAGASPDGIVLGGEEQARIVFGKVDASTKGDVPLGDGTFLRGSGKISVENSVGEEASLPTFEAASDEHSLDLSHRGFVGVELLKIDASGDIEVKDHEKRLGEDKDGRMVRKDEEVPLFRSGTFSLKGQIDAGLQEQDDLNVSLGDWFSPAASVTIIREAGVRALYTLGWDSGTLIHIGEGDVGVRGKVKVEAAATAGAILTAELGLEHGLPHFTGEAGAFAGVRAGVTGEGDLLLNRKQLGEAHGGVSGWAGAGAGGKVDVGFTKDYTFHADAGAGAAVGYGFGVTGGCSVNVKNVAEVLAGDAVHNYNIIFPPTAKFDFENVGIGLRKNASLPPGTAGSNLFFDGRITAKFKDPHGHVGIGGEAFLGERARFEAGVSGRYKHQDIVGLNLGGEGWMGAGAGGEFFAGYKDDGRFHIQAGLGGAYIFGLGGDADISMNTQAIGEMWKSRK